MADIGYVALLLALMTSIYSAIVFAFGMRGRQPALIASARNSLLAVCGLVSISVAALLYAILSHDFRIEYVASYTGRDMSLPYLISALWAGNNGSLLFWGWLLSLFAAAVVLQKRQTGKELVPYAASIVMITEAFFLILLVSVSNPFHKLDFVPSEGMGLNPMLENPGMLFHPPTLLAGYVGFTIPFAFAMAALVSGRFGNEWIIVMRRWALIAWLFLGVGNIIGAWWAYVELGWGGYWAWDAVENAGLMPWLVATAFLHSSIMQRQKGMFKVWNMMLIILTFALTIFGTFLTRSGVLSSIHTFAESALGPFFLTFIGGILVGSLGLLYYRWDNLKSETGIESVVSRESTFLLNNLLLVGATFAIFIGTVFPAISEAIGGVKISVGAPFFNQVNGPIFLAVVLLAGICVAIGWQRTSSKKLMGDCLWSLILASILGIALTILGIRQWSALIGFTLCGFVVLNILYKWFQDTRARHRTRGENYLKAFFSLIWANKPRYGGYIVHIAITLIAIGVIGSYFYDVDREATLKPGESMTIDNYTLIYESMDNYETRSKFVVRTSVSVYDGGIPIGELTPEKYFHRSYDQPVTEVAIHTTLLEDLYVILVGWEEDNTATFKVLVYPLVIWIWIGGGILLIGGLIAFWPEKQRLPGTGQIKVRK